MGCRTADIGDDCTTPVVSVARRQLPVATPVSAMPVQQTRGQTHGHALAVVPAPENGVFPSMFPPPNGLQIAVSLPCAPFPTWRSEKRAWEQTPCAPFRCQAAVPMRPAVSQKSLQRLGKCAQGDSNSHPAKAGQGPQGLRTTCPSFPRAAGSHIPSRMMDDLDCLDRTFVVGVLSQPDRGPCPEGPTAITRKPASPPCSLSRPPSSGRAPRWG